VVVVKRTMTAGRKSEQTRKSRSGGYGGMQEAEVERDKRQKGRGCLLTREKKRNVEERCKDRTGVSNRASTTIVAYYQE